MKEIILRSGIDRRTLLTTMALLAALSTPPLSVSASAQTASSGPLPSWNRGDQQMLGELHQSPAWQRGVAVGGARQYGRLGALASRLLRSSRLDSDPGSHALTRIGDNNDYRS